MLYVLIALALLAALTMAISNQNNASSDLSAEKLELLTTQTVAFAAGAKNVVDQMMMSGTQVGNLDYLKPGDTGYDVPPYHNRIFHPDGGGLSLPAVDPNVFISTDDSPVGGWYIGRFNNVEWTPTAADDVLLTAYGMNEELCRSINKKITGSTDIPVVGDVSEELFVDTFYGGAANVDLTEDVCPDCEGWPALCVTDGQERVYYNIISAQ